MKTILTLFFLFSIHFNVLWACSCPGSSVISDYHKAATVIYGKVIEQERVEIKATLRPELYDTVYNALEIPSHVDYDKHEYFCFKSVLRVKIAIIEQYKEQSQVDTVVIFTYASSAGCGYDKFETGKEFIIFGFHQNYVLNHHIKLAQKIDLTKENSFWTHLCTANRPAEEKDLHQVRELALPRFNKKVFEITLTALMSRDLIDATTDTLRISTTFDFPELEFLEFKPRQAADWRTNRLEPIKLSGKTVDIQKNMDAAVPVDLVFTKLLIKEDKEIELVYKSYAQGGVIHSGSVFITFTNGHPTFELITYLSQID